MKTLFGTIALTALFVSTLSSQAQDFVFKANYDESKIPAYELPDVLEGVESADDWGERRAALYQLLSQEMFGKTPDTKFAAVEIREEVSDVKIMTGKAVLRQLVVTLAGRDLHVAMFLPASSNLQPCPVFLGYNFGGNHTVSDHPKMVLTDSWMRKAKDNQAAESDRGKSASRWAIEKIIDAGFGLVTLYYGDVDPDFDDGFRNGVHEQLGVPAKDEAGSIATWAWALSRVLDVLETVPEVDVSRVAVIGHSRLGKTSLWAGASDERFALVISNNSGCGGAALSRRRVGETVWRINDSFPHWFCGNFKKYGNNESAMPFDNHTLLALIAPRPLYVASAEDDKWADPKGEFLSCLHASSVYELLDTDGLPTEEMPNVNEPVHGQIGYHIRTGKHDVTDFDWQQYLKFATKHFGRKR